MRKANRHPPRRSTKSDASPSFEEDYLDIDPWIYRWQIESSYRLAAERMLDIFKLFLSDLLQQNLARRTLLMHRDHVCALGEAITGRLKPSLRRSNMAATLLVFLDDDGGPIIYPPTSSSEQRSFDSTCLKLRNFLLGP